MTAHMYKAKLTWTGNLGEGTSGYKAYTRDYDVAFEGKPVIKGSSDPNYIGDATRHDPEDMLLAALSACHMLWYGAERNLAEKPLPQGSSAAGSRSSLSLRHTRTIRTMDSSLR